MKKIVYSLNMVIAGLMSIIFLMGDWYEVTGWKLVLFTIVGAVVIDRGLLMIENRYMAFMKELKNDEKREGTGAEKSFSGKPRNEVRYTSIERKNRNTRADFKAV